jgi:tRNA uridine 5-carboxymethylaminomethyl modification enzyme
MFTSRAEYRLTLREDNADQRLTPAGRELGLVDDQRWQAFESKMDAIARERDRLGEIRLKPENASAAELLRRPGEGYASIVARSGVGPSTALDGLAPERREQVALALEVEAKYAGYIDRQQREVAKHAKQEALRLPEDIDYSCVDGLSNEARQRLAAVRPATVGQASRLEGMTPSAVSLLLIHLKKRQLRRSA